MAGKSLGDTATGGPYNVNGDQFEWDAAKSAGNLEKHGVSFEAARRVFDDMFACERVDSDSEAGEIRTVLTGMVSGVVLTVVYTERSERIRIISARKSMKHEQREYYRSRAAN